MRELTVAGDSASTATARDEHRGVDGEDAPEQGHELMMARRGSAETMGGAPQLTEFPAMSDLIFRERPADGDPEGLLVLHHGRGADEHDLLSLGDVLDPQRRLHVATPRAPLTLPGWPGYHWYVVPRVGYPDHDTFHAAYAKLAGFHDELWERTGVTPERTVFGGFSMGSVMSYSLGLGADRPAPAGILAFSGFVPIVDGLGARPRRAGRPRGRSSPTAAATR